MDAANQRMADLTKQRLREIVTEIAGVTPLSDDTEVELTSLQQIEFVLRVEEDFGVEVHEEPTWKTVNEVSTWLHSLQKGEADGTESIR